MLRLTQVFVFISLVGFSISWEFEYVFGNKNGVDTIATYVLPEGTPSNLNDPGARSGANFWKHPEKEAILLLGGNGYEDGTPDYTYCVTDFWEFDPGTGEWIVLNKQYEMGECYLFSSDLQPPIRQGSTPFTIGTWIYFFGGFGLCQTCTPDTNCCEDDVNFSGWYQDTWRTDMSVGTPGNYQWLSHGSGHNGEPAINGSLSTSVGVFDDAYFPYSRMGATAVTYSETQAFIFGGQCNGVQYDYTQSSFSRGFNDVWAYNGVDNNWAWFKGVPHGYLDDDDLPSFPAEKRVYDVDNLPLPRLTATLWIQKGGIFMHSGLDKRNFAYYNDFWCYNISLNQWAFLHGNGWRDISPIYGPPNEWGDEYYPGSKAHTFAFGNTPNINGDWSDDYLFLFGGASGAGNVAIKHDFWIYSIMKNQFMWVGGTSDPLAAPDYVSPDYPGARGGGKINYSNRVDRGGGTVIIGNDVWFLMGYATVQNEQTGRSNEVWKLSNYGVYTCYGKEMFLSTVCSGKGICQNADNCTCPNGYHGDECEKWYCNGINNTDYANVCSNHGECLSQNNCTCEIGYAGVECEKFYCNGIQENETSVCSGYGTCVSPEECECFPGYFEPGTQCDNWKCFGTFHDSGSCSLRGTCTSPDNCNCTEGYTFEKCQSSVCFGFPDNDTTNVCSGHGSCVAPGLCICSPSTVWGGLKCDKPVCYGIVAGEAGECSENGNCVSPGNCSCNDGFLGDECEIWSCFGFQANAIGSVCSGHGTCQAINDCLCTGGYTHEKCQHPECNSIPSNYTTDVCSGNGICSSPDFCTCVPFSDWGGQYCNISKCGGVLAGDAGECSNHGTCVSPNNCSCFENYTGSSCLTVECWGLAATDTTKVCSGNGFCVDVNYCVCTPAEDWGGEECNVQKCFGYEGTDLLNVCSGHGSCDSPQNCSCIQGYGGQRCETYTCFGTASTEYFTVCSSHGSCDALDKCSCNLGYVHEQCQHPQCYSVPSNYTGVVCSGNGDCSSPDVCTCYNSSEYGHNQCQDPVCHGVVAGDGECSGHGTCLTPNNCLCDDGYGSDDCSQVICHGHLASDIGVVCSGNGACVTPDFCICQPIDEWGNETCNSPKCFGFFEGLNLCSGNGACVAPNNCSCVEGYGSPDCSEFVCHDYLASDTTNVCSGHGVCTGVNNCICSPGADWDGSTCNQTKCFGIAEGQPGVCSGNGVCVTPQNCSCYPGYTNLDCSEYECFDTPAGDIGSVCSGHGTCESIDNCTCLAGYQGDNCQMIECFGYTNNDTNEVCSGHGSCISLGVCSCDPVEEWGSEDCSMPMCNGVVAGSVGVCSGNGNCTAPENCLCESGYGTSDCSVVKCNDILATNTVDVCFGHGSCVGKDICICNPIFDWGHTFCSEPTCYGITKNDPGECSNHGTCMTPQNCSCSGGYEGLTCNEYGCYGYPKSDVLNVCSGRGNCDSINQCTCFDGYSGFNCERTYCYGILDNETSSVCSGHGNCVGINVCQCQPISEWGNSSCNVPKCFGLSAGSEGVCFSRGNCTSPDKCSCIDGYAGDDCTIPVCDGIKATETAIVCSGHGNCISPDTCSCDPPDQWGSNNCSKPICFGIVHGDTYECKNRGVCISPGNCSCQPGVGGLECETYSCFNIPANDYSKVCSGHGACTTTDECECFRGFTHERCHHHECFFIAENETISVCSGHGNCIAVDACICDTSYANYDCSDPICFGAWASHTSIVCSGVGNCTSPDNCVCKNGYVGEKCEIVTCFDIPANKPLETCNGVGVCDDVDTCTCHPDVYGKQCQAKVLIKGVIELHKTKITDIGGIVTNQRKATLKISYMMKIDQITPKITVNEDFVGCEYLFPDTSALGENPVCSFSLEQQVRRKNDDDKTTEFLEVNLGQGYVLKSEDTIEVYILSVNNTHGNETVEITLSVVSQDIDLGNIFMSYWYAFAGFGGIIGIIAILIVAVGVICCCCVCRLGKKVKKYTDVIDEDELQFMKMEKEENEGSAGFTINKKLFEIDYDDIKLLKQIGDGGSDSTVFHCLWKGRDCAIKIFKSKALNDQAYYDAFEQEVSIVSSISHPSVLAFFGCCLKLPKIGIVTELCENGDLREYMIRNKRCFTFVQKVKILSDVASAMDYLHSRNVIHRDLKTNNVLVASDLSPRVMDFGLSRIVKNAQNSSQMTKRTGTSIYMAPQITLGEKYSSKCDSFSMGIMMFEILTENFHPYGAINFPVEVRVAKDPTFRPKINEDDYQTERWYIKMMKQCWEHEEEPRPTFEQLLKEFSGKYRSLTGKKYAVDTSDIGSRKATDKGPMTYAPGLKNSYKRFMVKDVAAPKSMGALMQKKTSIDDLTEKKGDDEKSQKVESNVKIESPKTGDFFTKSLDIKQRGDMLKQMSKKKLVINSSDLPKTGEFFDSQGNKKGGEGKGEEVKKMVDSVSQFPKTGEFFDNKKEKEDKVRKGVGKFLRKKKAPTKPKRRPPPQRKKVNIEMD